MSLHISVITQRENKNIVKVPKLKNHNLKYVKNKLKNSDLKLNEVYYREKSGVKNGVVYFQSPTAGESKPKGTHVNVWVAQNEEVRTFSNDNDNIDEIRNKAYEYYENGDYQNALDKYNDVLDANNLDAHSLIFKGYSLLNLKQYNNAIHTVTTYINNYPHNADGYYARGRFYLEMEKYRESISDINNSMDKDYDTLVNMKNNGYSFYVRAKSKYGDRLYKSAYSDIRKAIKKDKKNDEFNRALNIIKKEL